MGTLSTLDVSTWYALPGRMSTFSRGVQTETVEKGGRGMVLAWGEPVAGAGAVEELAVIFLVL